MMNEPKPSKTSREQWVELRTATERIEGIVHMPKSSKGRRIGDFLTEADRAHCGMLHLTTVTVFDLKTNRIKFHKPSLAVNRSMVVYASPLAASEMLPNRVWEPPMAGVSTN